MINIIFGPETSPHTACRLAAIIILKKNKRTAYTKGQGCHGAMNYEFAINALKCVKLLLHRQKQAILRPSNQQAANRFGFGNHGYQNYQNVCYA